MYRVLDEAARQARAYAAALRQYRARAGSQLAFARRAAGYTQRALAEALGLGTGSATAVAEVERGVRALPTGLCTCVGQILDEPALGRALRQAARPISDAVLTLLLREPELLADLAAAADARPAEAHRYELVMSLSAEKPWPWRVIKVTKRHSQTLGQPLWFEEELLGTVFAAGLLAAQEAAAARWPALARRTRGYPEGRLRVTPAQEP